MTVISLTKFKVLQRVLIIEGLAIMAYLIVVIIASFYK